MEKLKSRRRIRVVKRLIVAIGVAFVLAGATTVVFVNQQMKAHALSEAKAKARLLLDQNLAVHHYFSQRLKPAIFSSLETADTESVFEPAWMSSTFAVREIEKYANTLSDTPYYYKECAINARHPENEADSYERTFLELLNRDASIDEQAAIREYDGQYFYTVLRRGETMEENCLRCHSVPELAPAGLLDIYGDSRSFNRSAGEVVSAISIRIPLAVAYDAANRLSLQLAAFFCIILTLLFSVVLTLKNRWILAPLDAVRKEAQRIASDPKHLGVQIEVPKAMEMAELAVAFNKMSDRLLNERELLERRVAERTADLDKANEQLEHEIIEHKKAIVKLEETLSEIKSLQGILPICCYCKNIRDDAGYWNQLEAYLLDHSDAELSHGICPDCAEKNFPDMDLSAE